MITNESVLCFSCKQNERIFNNFKCFIIGLASSQPGRWKVRCPVGSGTYQVCIVPAGLAADVESCLGEDHRFHRPPPHRLHRWLCTCSPCGTSESPEVVLCRLGGDEDHGSEYAVLFFCPEVVPRRIEAARKRERRPAGTLLLLTVGEAKRNLRLQMTPAGYFQPRRGDTSQYVFLTGPVNKRTSVLISF